MAKAKAAPGVDPELKKAITEELKEVRKKGDDGKPAYGILDRMRVYGAALKLAAIEAKLNLDDGYGEGYGQGDD